MVTLPMKTSVKEQCSVIRSLFEKDYQMLFTLKMRPCDKTSTIGIRSLLVDNKVLLMKNRYGGAISFLSVAWTAASIVLCRRHSETCL